MDTKRKVIDKFNEMFGADLKNLDNIKQFHEQLEKEKYQIEESVNIHIAYCLLIILNNQ